MTEEELKGKSFDVSASILPLLLENATNISTLLQIVAKQNGIDNDELSKMIKSNKESILDFLIEIGD